VKTWRRGALTRVEVANRGQTATGRGTLGHGTLWTRPFRMAARRARHRTGCRGGTRGEATAASGSAAAASDTGRSERGRSEWVYTCAHGVGQHRPARPIGAKHCMTLPMTSGPRVSVIF
jgi:hypothetical protein